MNNKDMAMIVGGAIVIGAMGAVASIVNTKRRAAAEIEHDKIVGSYPPEYWEKEKTRIESSERLTIDKRNREDQKIKDKLEFEKNAPKEYWDQKRFAEEEETRRQRYLADAQVTQKMFDSVNRRKNEYDI